MPATDRPPADGGLAVTGLTARAGTFAIGPVSLAVAAGQVLVVLGPSGAGKTILLHTIAGLRPHLAGQVRLAGADLTALPPERRRIGLVFQDAALFPHLSVSQNVAFGPRATRQAPGDHHDALLDRLGITHLASRCPSSLSGGERQRVALARALATSPALLLLDEPMSALDQPAREDMRALLQELLAGLDIPAVHVTHDRDEALSIGDHLAIIVAGQLRQAGPASQVTTAPADPDAARLLGWTHLAHGTATRGTVRAGQLTLACEAPGTQGPVHIYYRPEDILLSEPGPGTPPGASLTAPVRQVLPTRPLARISLASDPPLTAHILHRGLGQLHLQPGTAIQVTLPPGSTRIFPAT